LPRRRAFYGGLEFAQTQKVERKRESAQDECAAGAQMEQKKRSAAEKAARIPRTNFIYYSLSLLYAKRVDYKGTRAQRIIP
jgi:hypothetical protein